MLNRSFSNPIGLYKFGMFMASELNTENLVFYLNVRSLISLARRPSAGFGGCR